MYMCLECKNIFEDPEETMTFPGRRFNGLAEPEEWTLTCPECGSEFYLESEECEDCQDVFLAEDLKDGLCPECAAKAKAYDEMIDQVKDALSTPIDMAQMVKSILTK